MDSITTFVRSVVRLITPMVTLAVVAAIVLRLLDVGAAAVGTILEVLFLVFFAAGLIVRVQKKVSKRVAGDRERVRHSARRIARDVPPAAPRRPRSDPTFFPK